MLELPEAGGTAVQDDDGRTVRRPGVVTTHGAQPGLHHGALHVNKVLVPRHLSLRGLQFLRHFTSSFVFIFHHEMFDFLTAVSKLQGGFGFLRVFLTGRDGC